jgi:DNA-binding LacI/PurR family transcriptional regulator
MISSLELSRLCGVSQGTVDRALHNRDGISDDTKKRILAAAAAHGYLPNPAAREVMTGRSRMVGALVPDMSSVFFMDFMNAMKEALAPQGLRVLLTTANTPSEFRQVLEDFAARRMRAALVVPPEEGLALPPHVTKTMKVISLLSPLVADPSICFLAPDEAETGRAAVRYLSRMGHRRILHLSYRREAVSIRGRARGYEEAMEKLGEVPMTLREVNAQALSRALETYRPTAVFCLNDPLALMAIRLLGDLGRRVPQDLSVLGVDNSPTFRRLYPDLTTMDYPREAIASCAAAWIAGKKGDAKISPCRIVEGKTVRRA